MINIFIKAFNKTHVLIYDEIKEISLFEIFIKGINKFFLKTHYKNLINFLNNSDNLDFINGCYIIFNSKIYDIFYQKKFSLNNLKDAVINIEFSAFRNNNLQSTDIKMIKEIINSK